MPPEPRITINGITLTNAQAAVVRCAITDFDTFVTENQRDLGEIGPLYKERLKEIYQLMRLVDAA